MRDLETYDVLVVGAGVTGSVIARQLAEKGKHVLVWDRRNHIAGNLYDYIDEHGFLVQQYGPHVFHTKEKHLFDYLCSFGQWNDYEAACGAVWGGKYTSVPFDFSTIDTFFPQPQADALKAKLNDAFPGRKTVPVLEILHHPDEDIRGYGEYLFRNDYAPYTAKQWGISPNDIDPSVLARVPVCLYYRESYFEDEFQAMPKTSFTDIFRELLSHQNITVTLNIEALEHLTIHQHQVRLDGEIFKGHVVYTGALDELFGCIYGELPYRSLHFEWHYTSKESFQPVSVVAYPQEAGFTRITEFKKLPLQDQSGSSYAVEYPIPYHPGQQTEPYYPVLTKESQEQYRRYQMLADRVENFSYGGRLADFKYYNIDQALQRALDIADALR